MLKIVVKNKNSIFNGAAWYFLEKIIRLIGAFFIGAWIARYLGPDNYGTLAYVVALVSVLGFFGSFGIESLVVRDLVQNRLEQHRIVSTYFFIRFFGAIFVPFLALSYLISTHDDIQPLIVLVVFCSSVVVFGAIDVADCWLQAEQKARVTSVIRLFGFLISTLIKLLLIYFNASLEWFAAVIFVESAVIASLYFSILSRHKLVPSLSYLSFFELKKLIIDGRTMALSALMVAIYSKIDVLVIGTLLSKEVLAPYAVAASMCAAWNMVGTSLVQAWAPRLSSSICISKKGYISELRKMLVSILVISIAGSALLSFFSDYIFNILLGDSYSLGISVFNILVWSSIFVFMGVATSQILVNEKIYWISLVRTFVGVAVSLSLIIPIAKNFGALGVAALVVFSSAAATLSILFSSAARNTLKTLLISKAE